MNNRKSKRQFIALRNSAVCIGIVVGYNRGEETFYKSINRGTKSVGR